MLAAEAGHTLAKVLRSRLHASQPSWTVVRAVISARRVKVGDALCTDPARRLKEGEIVELLGNSVHRPRGATTDGLVVRHLDDHVIVVEKAAGINSVRHPSELEWPDKHRELDPTLQDLALWAAARQLNRPPKSLPPLRIVHRLDKETSGLVVFARTAIAERGLGLQFRKHTVVRRYLAVVPGHPRPQTIASDLVRDRGDGRRGSTKLPNVGKHAVTHITVEEKLAGYTLLSCRLETGRTHQIRIHLSESGHPVCGDKVYCRRPNGDVVADPSGAPRLALHATELGFEHPITGGQLHWSMPLPPDLVKLVDRLRKGGPRIADPS
ncbi:Ribosomal large subunit pseudouridine synthase D [Fimbriiglobus ruber]|uniref:Pseudouridine synthase n=1 Tax=Fimbriiglobus ruber TaxID=1908690 RepID=A0A225EF56_9BACT|nr:Ribosomal large subunit pseudouridine synthase D [Fimbriiglobus ruber]